MPIRVGSGYGETRDISLSGLYFVTDETVRADRPLTLTVSFESKDAGLLRVRYTGEVLRIDRLGEKIGVAVGITAFGFETAEN